VNPRNDWLIDRDMQRNENFTGIQGVNAQDRAVQEAMGPIVNRSKEHLGQTDRAVIMTRRMLLRAIDTVADGGTPPGLGESYYSARAIEDVLPDEEFGLEALAERMFVGGR
jgi:phthalate 4,5-dioxygenase oxygenase subunit